MWWVSALTGQARIGFWIILRSIDSGILGGDRLLHAAKRHSQWNARFGPHSGHSRRDPRRRAIRPIEASKAAMRNGSITSIPTVGATAKTSPLRSGFKATSASKTPARLWRRSSPRDLWSTSSVPATSSRKPPPEIGAALGRGSNGRSDRAASPESASRRSIGQV